MGGVVGVTLNDQGEEIAFGWTAGEMHFLKGLSPSRSGAFAVNNSGQVVGSSLTAGGQESHAFLWTRPGTVQDLGTLGTGTSIARAINNNGEVVGSYGQLQAFFWTQSGGMQDLRNLTKKECPLCEITPFGINDSGIVVGDLLLSPADSHYAFVLNARSGSSLKLGDLGGGRNGINSQAIAVNRSGQVVGAAGTPSGAFHAFLWTLSGGMQDLGVLPGYTDSGALGISNSGQVVGMSYSTITGNYRAFLWTPSGGMQDLGTLGGENSGAVGINDAGEVAGYSEIP